MIYIFLFLIMLVIDQYTKFIINTSFYIGETVAIIEDFFHLTYVENRGIAFGLFQGKIDIVSIFATVAIVCILIHIFKNFYKITIFERVAYIMILSGAIGNMIDRLIRGFVIDMLDFRGLWSFVFNFADVWINLGIFLLLLDSLYLSYKEKRKKKEDN